MATDSQTAHGVIHYTQKGTCPQLIPVSAIAITPQCRVAEQKSACRVGGFPVAEIHYVPRDLVGDAGDPHLVAEQLFNIGDPLVVGAIGSDCG